MTVTLEGCMNLYAFSSDNGSAPLLDLVVSVNMQTDSSVSLSMGRFTNHPRDITPELRDLLFLPDQGSAVFEELGWIDVHYPCNGPIKVLVRMEVPEEYRRFEKISFLVCALFRLLLIPENERYVAHWHDGKETQTIIHAADEHGIPDKFYS